MGNKSAFRQSLTFSRHKYESILQSNPLLGLEQTKAFPFTISKHPCPRYSNTPEPPPYSFCSQSPNQSQESVARGAIGVPARVGSTARAPTTIAHVRSRRILLPVGHAVRLVPVPPVAPLAHVPNLPDHLLLRPDGMAPGIIPLARRG